MNGTEIAVSFAIDFTSSNGNFFFFFEIIIFQFSNKF